MLKVFLYNIFLLLVIKDVVSGVIIKSALFLIERFINFII